MPEPRTLQVTRTARYHVLGGPAAVASEAWVALHGYGQLAGPFLESLGVLAEPRRLLLAPEALSRFYLRGGTGVVGASWMTREARAEEIADTLGYLERLAAHELGPRLGEVGLHAFGFSQGGAAVARWALLGRTPLARVTLWGCALPPDLDPGLHAERARRVRWTFVLGDQDESVDHAVLEGGLERLRAAGCAPERIRFAGGHELAPAPLQALARGARGD